MKQKSHGGDYCKEMEQALRLLDSIKTDLRSLHQLYVTLSRGRQRLATISGKIESSLLSMLNPQDCKCELQSSVHPHFPSRDPLSARMLSVAACCFSLLPSLAVPSCRFDRFADFQSHLIYCLCDAFLSLLEFHGYSQLSLFSLRNHLASRTKPFVSLKPFSRDQMPSPELMQLLYARVDFFTHALRQFFESGAVAEAYINLPLTVSLFNSVLSVELSHSDKASNDMLLRSSRLMHCFASIFRVVGPKLLPASAPLFALLTYQLDWTAQWFCEKKLMEGLVRHRLAALNCLQGLLHAIDRFGSDRLRNLLPKILGHMIQDLVHVCDLDPSTVQLEPDEELVSLTNLSHGFPGLSTNLAIKRRMLIAVLLLVKDVFSTSSLYRFHGIGCNESKRFFDVASNINARREVTRLSLCLTQLMNQVSNGFSWNSIFKDKFLHQMNHVALFHPLVLIELCKTVNEVSGAILSPSFQVSVHKFLSELSRYPNVHVAANAYASIAKAYWNDCEKHCTATRYATGSKVTNDLLMLPCSSTMANEVPEPAPSPLNSALAGPPNESLSIGEQSTVSHIPEETAPSPKRVRLSNGAEEQTGTECGHLDRYRLSLDDCLATFDPTLM